MPTATVQQKISGLYAAFFDRAPDKSGLDTWVAKMAENGNDFAAISGEFTAHPVFASTYGSMTNQQFVEAIYVNMLGSAGNSDGIAHWVGLLDAGTSQASVVAQFVTGALEIDLDALLESGDLTQAEYDAAVIRQDNVTNKADVGVDFANKLGAASNVTETDPAKVDQDPAFKASQAALEGVDNTTASKTAAVAKIDAAVATGNPVNHLNGGTTGATFTLTADDDTVVGTANDDTVNATSSTLAANDVILDQSNTDADALNINATAAITAAARIEGIESINVDLDLFSGGAINAANITDATITASSSKLGFDGEFTANNTGDNNVTAGTGITDLIVDDLSAGTVDAGSADTVTITTDNTATDNAIALTVNGDVDVTATFDTAANETETLAITATAASVVTIASGDLTFSGNATGTESVTGSGAVTLDVDGDDLDGVTVSGFSNVDLSNGSTSVDVSNWTVDAIEVSIADAASSVVLNDANAQTINVSAEDVDLAVNGDAAAADTDETVTVNVNADQADADADGAVLALTDFDTVTVNLAAAVTELASLTIEGDAIINVAGDVEIVDLNKTAVTDTVAVTGAGNVTITDLDDVASVTSTGLTGNLDLTLSADVDIEVTAGAGDDTITVAVTNNIAAVNLGDGTNVLDASTIAAGTLAVQGGAGVDTVMLDTIGASTVALAGGAGNDVINVAANGDLTGYTTWATTGFNTLTVTDSETDAVAAITLDIDGSQLVDMTSLSIAASVVTGEADEADDTLTVNVAANEATTDLSGLVVADTTAITTEITGQATAETIKGTNASDTIIAGGGADVLTGGADADTFVFAADDSTEAAMASITDFNVTEFDVLDLAAGAVTADAAATDVSAVTSETGDTVTASVTDGIMTLAGDDAANIDTLAEWIDAAEVLLDATTGVADTLAFVFDSNTYVIENGTDDAVDNIIELTGVSGLTAVDTAAGVNTLVIA